MADDTATTPNGELSESATAVSLTKSDSDAETDTPDDTVDAAETEAEEPRGKLVRFAVTPQRLVLAMGLVVVLALGGLVGWLGFRANESHEADKQREVYLQVARQGVLNFSSIDWENADADVQRILDSATGSFREYFAERYQPFVDLITQTQTSMVATVNEAGLESVSGNEAKVLATVTVKISNMSEPEQDPRFWRMRVTVQKDGDQEKVSNVEFV